MNADVKMLLDGIDELGQTYSTNFSELKVKYQRLETELEQMQQKNATAGMGGGNSLNKDFSLSSNVKAALADNGVAENLKQFIRGEKDGRFAIEVKDMSLANLTGGAASLNSNPVGIVGALNRFSHVRDIMPKVMMTGGTLPIIRDNGATGTFTPVAEGGTKPVIDFNLAEQPAKAEVIAAIVNVTRQFLDDLGPHGVMNWLQGRLTELYLIAEDDQLLNGNGVSPNLSGVNNTGNFTAATSLTASNNVVQLVTTIVQMRTLGRTPRVIIIHPTDLTSLLLNQATGSGEFDLPNYVSVNAQGGLSIMGVPLIDTVAQTEGQFNVLDTSQMVMGIRENFKIQFFEQDGSNVRTNRITVRAEARIAFATYSEANTIKGTF